VGRRRGKLEKYEMGIWGNEKNKKKKKKKEPFSGFSVRVCWEKKCNLGRGIPGVLFLGKEGIKKAAGERRERPALQERSCKHEH